MPVKPSVGHVGLAGHHVVALDIADEVDAPLVRGLLQQLEGLLLQLPALGGLRAVAQQTDFRLRHAEDVFGVKAAHEGKLQEPFLFQLF